MALGEDILAMEPMPQLRRESRRRRSSYAFSHREGYANLITQGTSLRRAPGANPEVTYESVGEPQDEAPPEAPRTPKRMSLGDKRPSVEAAIPSPDLTPSFQDAAAASSDEAPGPQQVWGPRTRERRTMSPRRQSQTPPVPEEAPVSLPQVLELAPESESQLPEEKEEQQQVESEQGLLDYGSSLWRIPLQFWRGWPHAWPRDAHPDREDAPPTASAARASLPAGLGEAPAAEQPMEVEQWPMEVEPWPVEVEPSPMEWLPVPLPAEEQPDDPRPSPGDHGKESFPFSNKPGSA